MACVMIVGDENGSGPAPIATAIITRAHVHVYVTRRVCVTANTCFVACSVIGWTHRGCVVDGLK